MIVADLFAQLGIKVDTGAFANADSLIGKIKAGLAAFATFEVGKGLFEMVEGVGEAAVQTGRLAQKLGITTASVQELGYAASVSGASTEDMQVSLQHLARGLDEAKTKGSGPAADAFRRLGISMQDPAVKAGDLSGITQELADKFAKMPDGATKTALAMDLFGRSGTSLIPTLDRGGAAIKALGDEFKDTGAEIDDNTIKSFEELEGTQKRLSATWDGFKTQIAVALLPVIQDIATGLLEWFKENKALIASRIKSFVSGLTTVIRVMASVIGWAVDHWKILAAILGGGAIVSAIGAIATAIEGFAAAMTVAGAEGAAGFLLALGPIGLVVAAVIAAIAILEKYGDAIRHLPVIKQLGDAGVAIERKMTGGEFGASYEQYKVVNPGYQGSEEDFEAMQQDNNEKRLQSERDKEHSWSSTPASTSPHTVTVPAGTGPAASAGGIQTASGTVVNNTIGDVHVAVTATPGVDASTLAQMVGDQFDQKIGQTLRDAHAGSGGADVP